MAWTATPKEITKSDDGTGLVLKLAVTNGTYTETLTRPMFRPSLASEVDETAKNIIAEVKARKEQVDKINAMYADVQKKINTPINERAIAEVTKEVL